MKKRSSVRQAVIAFFADSSPFLTWVGKAALLAVLNLCWLLSSLPVVTAGAATAALFQVLEERSEHSYLSAPGAFFRAFRRWFQPATILWLPLAAALGLLLWDLRLLLLRGLTDSTLAMTPLLLGGAAWLFAVLWLYPVLTRSGQGPAQALRTALVLGLGELWRSLAMAAAALILPALLLLAPAVFLRLLWLWLLFGVSAPALVQLRLMEPVLHARFP